MGDLFLCEDMRLLLRSKSICFIGDSVQRTIYKDFITLLQENRFASVMGLKAKGEQSYMGDTLVEGGLKSGPLHNGVDYREHRLYETAQHTVRFFFVTRVWDDYWKHDVMPILRQDPKPDVVIVNSCLWDLTRYGLNGGVGPYRENLNRLLTEMEAFLPKKSLFIWNTTLPLSSDPDKIHGGFLVASVSVEDKMNLRLDILEANKFAAELVSSYKYDVLDLHYWFRGHQNHRVKDGIHWDNEATRQMTNLLLTRITDAWGLGRPGRLFQVALLSSGRDPLLLRELMEGRNAMDKHKEEDQNNNKGIIRNVSSAHASRSLSQIPPTSSSSSVGIKRSFSSYAENEDLSREGPKPKKAKKGVSFAV